MYLQSSKLVFESSPKSEESEIMFWAIESFTR